MLDIRFDFESHKHFFVILVAFNMSEYGRLCVEITDRYLSLSVILLFTYAVQVHPIPVELWNDVNRRAWAIMARIGFLPQI